MNLRDLMLSTNGRLGRRDFAYSAVILAIGSAGISLLPVVGPIIGIALLWAWRALAAKRLHDMGRNHLLASALMVANIGVSVGGLLLSFGAGSAALGLLTLPLLGVFALVATIIGLMSLAFLLWLVATPSDSSANRFGKTAEPLDFQTLLG